MRQPYSGTSMVVRPGFRVDTVVHLCRVLKAWSPSRRKPFWLFLLSIPMVVLLMELDDDMIYKCWSLYLQLWKDNCLFLNIESWACLHPQNFYMLELSPASTKCNHGAADKLFCRYTCHWPEPSTTQCKVSKPWDGRPPRWAVYNSGVPMTDKSVT